MIRIVANSSSIESVLNPRTLDLLQRPPLKQTVPQAAFQETHSWQPHAAASPHKHQTPGRLRTRPADTAAWLRIGAFRSPAATRQVRPPTPPVRSAPATPEPPRARAPHRARTMRFTSAKSANNATPPQPTAAPFSRATKNRTSGLKSSPAITHAVAPVGTRPRALDRVRQSTRLLRRSQTEPIRL